MKTAVIISGHVRSFQWVLGNQLEKLFSRVPEPHFFISVIDDSFAKSIELLKQRFSHVTIEYIPGQPDCVGPVGKSLLGENARHEDIDAALKQAALRGTYRLAPHANPQTVFGSLWHQQRAFRMAREKFDVYIRHRPDLYFVHLDVPAPKSNECFVPWWSSWGGINDRFAIMGQEAATAYFSQFDHLADLLRSGVPLHPESLSGAAMKAGRVSIRPLNVDFSAVRTPDAAGRIEQVPSNYSVTDIYNLVRSLKLP
jgi:hypothetical protein